MSMTYSFTAQRQNERRTKPEKLVAQLTKMAKAALRGNRGGSQGWRLCNQIVAPQPRLLPNGIYEYNFTFYFEKHGRKAVSTDVANRQFIEGVVHNAALAGNLHKWTVIEYNVNVSQPQTVATSYIQEQEEESFITNLDTEFLDDDSYDIVDSPANNAAYMDMPSPSAIIRPASVPVAPQPFNISLTPIEVNGDNPINLDPTGYFDHIYDREAQITVLLGGVRTAVETDFKERNHALIFGDPAGGKTTLCKAFMDMVGEENCHYIDMTTTTQAGILMALIERPTAPKFLIIEELEKVKKEDMRWLLGVMDERGEINVCNSKVGSIRMAMPVYVIATINDMDKFQATHGGAIESRFGDKIYCPKVSRDTIYKRVLRAVLAVGGDESWVNPAIDYCTNYEGTCDIRRIKTVATGGRERLLTGEYQRILQATSRPR